MTIKDIRTKAKHLGIPTWKTAETDHLIWLIAIYEDGQRSLAYAARLREECGNGGELPGRLCAKSGKPHHSAQR